MMYLKKKKWCFLLLKIKKKVKKYIVKKMVLFLGKK